MTENQIIPLVTGPASRLAAYRIICNSLVPMPQLETVDRKLNNVSNQPSNSKEYS